MVEHDMVSKWQVPLTGVSLSVSPQTQFLHVGEQKGEIFVWTRGALIGRDKCRVHIEVFGTGQAIPQLQGFPSGMAAGRHYIGTVQMESGLVWHVFFHGHVW